LNEKVNISKKSNGENLKKKEIMIDFSNKENIDLSNFNQSANGNIKVINN